MPCPFLEQQDPQHQVPQQVKRQEGAPELSDWEIPSSVSQQRQPSAAQSEDSCPILSSASSTSLMDAHSAHTQSTSTSSSQQHPHLQQQQQQQQEQHAEGEAYTPGTNRYWLNKRPQTDGREHLRRRELRKLDREFTLDEVAQHRYVDDIWMVVDGKVYDITEHLVNHKDWETGAVTTPLSILAHGGMDCTKEFHELHRPYPLAYKQLPAYYIGELKQEEGSS